MCVWWVAGHAAAVEFTLCMFSARNSKHNPLRRIVSVGYACAKFLGYKKSRARRSEQSTTVLFIGRVAYLRFLAEPAVAGTALRLPVTSWALRPSCSSGIFAITCKSLFRFPAGDIPNDLSPVSDKAIRISPEIRFSRKDSQNCAHMPSTT